MIRCADLEAHIPDGQAVFKWFAVCLLLFLKSSENKIVTLSYLKVFGLFGSHNFLLFSSRLKQKQAVFYPNQSKKEQSGGKAERNDLILSNQILDAAKVNAQNFQESKNLHDDMNWPNKNQGLIVRKNTMTEEEETRQRLAKMEKSLLLLAEQQNHILSVLNGIAKWYWMGSNWHIVTPRLV